MRQSRRVGRRAYAALVRVLVFSAVVALVCTVAPDDGVAVVMAQAPSPNTPGTHLVAVSRATISLGSTLHASGKVIVANKPLANASVSLHMGDIKLAETRTNASGYYSFAVPIGLNCFPAAFANDAAIIDLTTAYNFTIEAHATIGRSFTPLWPPCRLWRSRFAC